MQTVECLHDFLVQLGVDAAATLDRVALVNGGDAFGVGRLLAFAAAAGHRKERRVGKLTHAQA